MNKTELDIEIKTMLINGIDADYLGKEDATTEEKIELLKADFYATQKWHVDRVGQQRAIVEWLQGLPSGIDILFMNYDILQYAKKIGSLPENPTERQEDKILDNWWNLCGTKLNQLFNGYRVPKIGANNNV
jgi:hypothetical protein